MRNARDILANGEYPNQKFYSLKDQNFGHRTAQHNRMNGAFFTKKLMQILITTSNLNVFIHLMKSNAKMNLPIGNLLICQSTVFTIDGNRAAIVTCVFL